MKITKPPMMSDPVYNAILQNWYGGAGIKAEYDKKKPEGQDLYYFSVTQLLKSPLEIFLNKDHYGEIENDAESKIWSVFGSAVHNILEKSLNADTSKRYETELRCVQEIEIDGKKYVISGQMDLLDKGVKNKPSAIGDYKVTTCFSFTNRDKYDADKEAFRTSDKWQLQLNMLRWLYYKERGIEVDELYIAPLFRDWSKNKSDIENKDIYTNKIEDYKYPPYRFPIIPQAVLSLDAVEMFIKSRIKLFVDAYERYKEGGANAVGICKERWESPQLWQVWLDGNSRSSRNCYSYKDAEDFILSKREKDIKRAKIIKKSSERKRCEGDFCGGNKFCPFYKRYLEMKKNPEEIRKSSWLEEEEIVEEKSIDEVFKDEGFNDLK